ncbi:MAG: hypothetical protein ACR2OU_07870 [Thermomicrobiales bacterium]
MSTVHATDIAIDLRANTLAIRLPSHLLGSSLSGIEQGTLDIGANGRLLGIELGPVYVSVMDAEPGRDDLVRSAEIPVTVSTSSLTSETVVTFRRSGSTWEISYPSGNQCWTRHNVFDADGQPVRICTVTTVAPIPPVRK